MADAQTVREEQLFARKVLMYYFTNVKPLNDKAMIMNAIKGLALMVSPSTALEDNLETPEEKALYALKINDTIGSATAIGACTQ